GGVVHGEGEPGAARAAAEAVEDLLVLVHLERGGLLVVEGTEPPEAAARFLQRDVATNDLRDVGALAYLGHDLLGDSTHSVPRSETCEQESRKQRPEPCA